MSAIKKESLNLVKTLYEKEKFSMSDIAKRLNVSLDAVLHFMRKYKIQRRNYFEANKTRFEKKLPSFKKRVIVSQSHKELRYIGATLYWAEGYKSPKSTMVDFCNSDPVMIGVFIKFLRTVYEINENKLRVLLYCYADQNVESLKRFWSKKTKIPLNQFTKPYIRHDFKKDGRKMEYGMIHVRYHDKKLWLDIMELIGQYKKKFA